MFYRESVSPSAMEFFHRSLQDHAYSMKYNTCQGPIFCSLPIPLNITYDGSLNVNENFCVLPFMDAQVWTFSQIKV